MPVSAGHKLPLLWHLATSTLRPQWISVVGFFPIEQSQTLARSKLTQKTKVWVRKPPHEPEMTHWLCVRLLEQPWKAVPLFLTTYWSDDSLVFFLRHAVKAVKKKYIVVLLFFWKNAYAIKLSPYLCMSFMREPGLPWGSGGVWLRGHRFSPFFPPHSALVTSELWENNTARNDGGRVVI